MTTIKRPQSTFESPPLFSANWLGYHPIDRKPRMVECFGPSAPDDAAAGQAAVLGLEPVQLGNPPPLTSVLGQLDGPHLVLHHQDREFLRTDPLPLSLMATLRWRPEVLLVWVDVPLRNPRVELPMVGLQHVWTGVASVRGRAR